MSVRLLATLGGLAAALAIATPVSAQEETRSVIVSFAGLDLARPADADRLERQLRMAARQVCGSDEPLHILARLQAVECEKSALDRAHADVQLALRGRSSTRIALTAR